MPSAATSSGRVVIFFKFSRHHNRRRPIVSSVVLTSSNTHVIATSPRLHSTRRHIATSSHPHTITSPHHHVATPHPHRQVTTHPLFFSSSRVATSTPRRCRLSSSVSNVEAMIDDRWPLRPSAIKIKRTNERRPQYIGSLNTQRCSNKTNLWVLNSPLLVACIHFLIFCLFFARFSESATIEFM